MNYSEEEIKKLQNLKLCKTVGQLIKELGKLPKTAKLSEPTRPIFYNISPEAKKIGLKPQVGFDDGY